VGAAAGAGVPAALVVLLGVVLRRYRFSDEAEQQLAGSVPLLGILPSLPERLIDPEQAAAAAHCVHQIRVMLEVGGGNGRRRRGVYLTTSTTPGEGKTSLTMSLGLSFATSGSRTLVMDCDVVGQRLTRASKLSGAPGLLDALNTGSVRGFARKTASGVWVMPVGTADVLDAVAISASQFQRLLADARRYFDIVIIDSGPVLGSVEATTIAPEVDGVIFAVSRGQEPQLVEKAMRHLQSIGATMVGFVFNRATRKDFARSAHASSLRSIPAESIPTRSLIADTENLGRFGPLVQAVVSLLPASREWVEPGESADAEGREAGAVAVGN
jgi:Mrp family chromosome partitioning ATPase